jgi:sugar phosphate isomerase/epimerase
MLRKQGYDKVLSIEHEDALMSIEEGLQRAIEFLSESIIYEEAAKPWWT